MTTSSNATEDGFDFIRKMWGNMGFNLPGVMTPTLDTEELERRITDLKSIEGWLKMNLNVLQMTIQGMEVQRATLMAVKAMSASATATSAANAGSASASASSSASSAQTPGAGEGMASVNPFANPALWTWPFAAVASASEKNTPAANPDKDAPPESAPEPSSKAPRKSTPKT